MCSLWGFPIKWWVFPPNHHWINRVCPLFSPSILGYHQFGKHPQKIFCLGGRHVDWNLRLTAHKKWCSIHVKLGKKTNDLNEHRIICLHGHCPQPQKIPQLPQIKASSPKIGWMVINPDHFVAGVPTKTCTDFHLPDQQPGKLTFWHGDLIHFIWVTFRASSRYFFWMPMMKGVLSRDPETPREVVWTALNVENEAGFPRTSPNLPRCFGRAYSKSSKPFGNIQPSQSGETRAWTISPPIFLLPIFTLPESKTCSAPSKMDDWKTMTFPFLLRRLNFSQVFIFRICTHKFLPLMFFSSGSINPKFFPETADGELCMPTSLYLSSPSACLCFNFSTSKTKKSRLFFEENSNRTLSTYCWRKKSCRNPAITRLRLVVCPNIYEVLYLLGARFLNHQQYIR